MEKMRMRDEVVMKCKQAAAERLVQEVSAHARYPELLKALITQGLLRLMEPDVVVQCRQSDVATVTRVLPAAIKLYEQTMKTGYDFEQRFICISSTDVLFDFTHRLPLAL